MSRSVGLPCAIVFDYSAQSFFAFHLGGTRRRSSARTGDPHSAAFPYHSPFCVRNRSDPKTTERDAKSASISVVRTCGFQQREYCYEESPSRGAFTSAAN